MYSNLTQDGILVSNYIRGCEASLEILIKKHKQRLYSFIFSKIQDRDITEDIFQDTFIKVIRTLKRGNYNEQGKFLPWVMRISHNLIIDHFRRDKKMPIAGRGNGNDEDKFDIFNILKIEDNNVEDEIIYNQILNDVRDLVELLPEDQKEVVKMRHFLGMSFKDIESALNERMEKMSDLIKNVDFFVDIDKVEQEIQPITDKLLKDL